MFLPFQPWSPLYSYFVPFILFPQKFFLKNSYSLPFATKKIKGNFHAWKFHPIHHIPVNVLFKLLAAIYLVSWLYYLTLFTVNVQGLMSWKVKYILLWKDISCGCVTSCCRVFMRTQVGIADLWVAIKPVQSFQYIPTIIWSNGSHARSVN